MKPNPAKAMQILIFEIRQHIPFDTPESTLCLGPCQGCSKKLIEFLESELRDWQVRLDQGAEPKLGDISKLAKIATTISKVLITNGFIGKYKSG